MIVPAYVSREACVPMSAIVESSATSGGGKTPDWRYEMARMVDGTYVLPAAFSERFELCPCDALVGEGSFGFVLAATDRISGDRVAVKFVARDCIPLRDWVAPYGAEDTRLVPIEVRVLQMLNATEATVRLIAYGSDRRFAYVACELWGAEWTQGAGSRDLFACVEAGKVPLHGVRKILVDVVKALKTLASHGLVHGDLKDENVLVSAEYRARVIDMGSVQADTPHAQPASAYRGTVLFAPREVVLGAAYVPRQAQMWSLGVLLHVLLHGRPPFCTPEAIAAYDIQLPKTSGDCLVWRLLSPIPSQRPSLDAILLDPFVSSQ